VLHLAFSNPGLNRGGKKATLRIEKKRSVFKNKQTKLNKKVTFLNLIKLFRPIIQWNFKKCKQLFEYQHLLLLRDI
jgi:hypothetical protein